MSELQIYDEMLIRREFEELIKMCRNNTNEEGIALIKKAFEIANEAHRGIKRRSGVPYILHPVAVAKIVVQEIGLGYKSICAALMHDVVEDNPNFTIDLVKSVFGETISYIVDGLTKIDVAFDKDKSGQAENFKRILLTMNDDIRVIIIKIADRLHNMRTLDAMPVEKQQKISNETLFLFAPLAYRLGFFEIKSELEDLSLKYLSPVEFNEISGKINATEAGRQNFFDRFIEPIEKKLKESNIKFNTGARTKSVYSVWNKMRNKSVNFEEIYDLFAVRIIFEPTDLVPERTQCWHIYSIITESYQSKNERLRDWISTPKTNGYEALHCTVMAFGVWVEVQIRTKRMEEIAERGFAAHWRYKDDTAQEEELDRWLAKIRDVLINPETNAIEYLDQFRFNMYSSEITLFTPRGKAVMLPKGVTVIDFAYTIHSRIGDRAIGAKVNHKLVSLSYVLNNGDQVEVLTAENAKPAREWLEYAKLPRTKARIETALKAEVQGHIDHGKELIKNKLAEFNVEPQSRVFTKLCAAYGVATKRELYSKVGSGIIQLDDFEKQLKENPPQKSAIYWGFGLIKKIIPGTKKTVKKDEPENENANETVIESVAKIDKKKPFLLKETFEKKLTYKAATCCNPIPGDNIIGFEISDGKVVVHRQECPEANKLAAEHGDKIIKVKWTTHKIQSFLALITMRGIDRIGILNDTTRIITGEMNVNMRKMNVESHDGIFEGAIELYVHSTDDLENLIKKISGIKGMEDVRRLHRFDT
ncbi:MAG: RelA/SpoT family protein [Prevotellaceae bacterium]|jgi:GTP pyrophosphokinase|nr:RelA/SpoT family protein [Prevotellaceae bacterium]